MFDINPVHQESELVKHIKQEANYAMKMQEEKGENIRKDDVERAAMGLLHLTKFTENYTDLRAIINRMNDFLRFGIFSPLTLAEGEFIYKKPGLATNRRNPYVHKDLTSIFYELAYRKVIGEYYDARNNINYPKMADNMDYLIPFFTGGEERIYIIKGTTLTNIYFDRAYMKDFNLSNGWFPKPAVDIPIIRYFIDNYYIDFCNFHHAAVNKLRNAYKLRVIEDNNQELKIFGVKFNIKKDVLFSKGSTF